MNMKQDLKTLLLTVGLSVLAPFGVKAETPVQMTLQSSKLNAHQYAFKSIEGDDINLSEYSGKVVMVVNTASKCGFTGQYKDLQKLYDTYKDRGFVVLGVPSADFAGQEFSEESKVKEFTEENFHITFPLTEISHVKGQKAHPFYKWASKQEGFLGGPKWNFHKYLIDAKGDFVGAYGTTISPMSVKIINDVEQALRGASD